MSTLSCTVLGCVRPVVARAMCSSHYKRWQEGRDLSTPFRKVEPARGCDQSGCANKHYAKGFCRFHYQRVSTGVDPSAPRYYRRLSTRTCVIADCERRAGGSLMCSSHRNRANRFHLTSIQLEQILTAGCEVCGSREGVVIDHDHSCCSEDSKSCGRCIRGGLCARCNLAIGHLRNDPEYARKVISYLSA